MKRPFAKSVIREIRKSLGRFIAIIAIVALGVGFLVGLLSATPDMKTSTDHYYDDTNMADLFIKSTVGLTQEDIATLRDLPEIENAMPAYVTDVLAQIGGEQILATRVYGLNLAQNDSDSAVNRLTLIEGRMPQDETECLVQRPLGDRAEIPVGTKITFTKTSETDDLSETYRITEYTVVGIVDNPFYFSSEKESSTIGNGRIGAILYVEEGCYSLDVYTDCYLTVAGAKDYEAFSDAYENYIEEAAKQVEAVADDRASLRYETVYGESKQSIDDAKAELEAQRSSTNAQLQQAREELDATKAKLDAAEAELSGAEDTLTANLQQLEDAKAELEAGQSELAAAEAEYNAGLESYEAGKEEYDAGKAAYDKGLEEYQNRLIDYKVGLQTYESNLENYEQLQEMYGAIQDQIDTSGAADADELIERLEALKGRLPMGSDTASIDSMIALLKSGNATQPQLLEFLTQLESMLADQKAELDAIKVQLDGAKATLDAAKVELDENRIALEEANRALLVSEVKLDLAKSEIDTGKQELQQAETAYQQGLAAYETGQNEYLNGSQDLQTGKAQYEEGLAALEANEQEAQETFDRAERRIERSEKELEALQAKWYVLDRNSNVSYASYKINVEKVADVARLFPIFFFLVAALVTLTTMTRMVEEQRIQIGTLKALGYRRSTIMRKYLIYCGLATVIGCIVGTLVGFQLFPTVINNAYQSLYVLPPLIIQFKWEYALISCSLEIACTLLATWAACRHSLREKPAMLMVPRAPKAGKRILLERIKPLWSRLSFTHKATCRNVFRYKKHLFMTVLGIAGCTALIVAAFGLNDSMKTIAQTQFEDVLQYDLKIDLNDYELDEPLETFLQDKNYTLLYSESATIESDEQSYSVTLYVPQDASSLGQFVHLRDRKEKRDLAFGENSVILTEKLAETLDLRVGEAFTVENSDGTQAQFTLSGITENYAGSYLYLNVEEYEQAFGEADYNTLFVQSGITESAEQDAAVTEILQSEVADGAEFTSQTKQSYDNLLSSIGFVILVLILSAGGLAVIVLYNLTNININERAKELATLRVLGYHHREVAGYIFREIGILSVLGTLVGLLFGKLLHHYVILTAESVDMMFGRSISPWSFLWAFLITIAFSVVVDLLMLIRLRRIQMVESMKAVD